MEEIIYTTVQRSGVNKAYLKEIKKNFYFRNVTLNWLDQTKCQ